MKAFTQTVAAFALPCALLLGTDRLAAGDIPQEPVHVSMHDGRLSVQATRVPVGRVLDELARTVELRAMFQGEVRDTEISVVFRELPVEEGIRRILKDLSYALSYGHHAFATRGHVLPRPIEIRILGSGVAHSGSDEGDPRASAHDDGARQLETLERLTLALRDAKDPEARAVALSALTDQEREGIITAATAAIRHSDPEVRRTALDTLDDLRLDQWGADAPLEFAAETIGLVTETALADPRPEFRIAALGVLADASQNGALDPLGQAGATAAAAALHDADPQVREMTLHTLEALDAEGSAEHASELALTDGEPKVRMEALMALARRGDPAALSSLAEAALDPDPELSALATELFEALQK